MGTRKKHQLDISLARVKDEGTRDALVSLVAFVNQLSQNVDTSGAVKGEVFKSHKGLFSVDAKGRVEAESFFTTKGFWGIGRRGDITGLSLATDQQSPFRVMTFTGTLASLADTLLSTPSGTIILGAFGFGTRAGSSTIWRPIAFSFPSGQGILWETDTTSGDTNSVRIKSNDVSNDNDYRVIVFYTET